MAPRTQNNLEEIRTEANIILKVVDQFIKAGNLDEATEHLEKAKLMDPTNAYVYAFQERIAFLREEAAKKNAASSTRKAMEEAARAKLDAERRRAEEERLKREAEQAKKLEEWYHKKLEAEKRHEEELIKAATGSATRETAATPSNSANPSPVPPAQQRVVTSVPPQKGQAPAPQNVQTVKSADQARDMYKRVLMLAWADGAVSPRKKVSSAICERRSALHRKSTQNLNWKLKKNPMHTHLRWCGRPV